MYNNNQETTLHIIKEHRSFRDVFRVFLMFEVGGFQNIGFQKMEICCLGKQRFV